MRKNKELSKQKKVPELHVTLIPYVFLTTLHICRPFFESFLWCDLDFYIYK